MRRFCRQTCGWLLCCILIAVPAYIVFDILDTDGSNLRRHPQDPSIELLGSA
jgi:hypothetical protein